MQKRTLGLLAASCWLLVAFLLFSLAAYSQKPAAITAQSGVTNFATVKASRDVIATRNITAGDNVAAGNFLNLAPQTGIIVTMNGWLTPTGSLQPLQSAGAVSISSARIAPLTGGNVLILLNVGAQTITISETTGIASAGNIVLGTLDSATLARRGSTWYQVAGSNN